MTRRQLVDYICLCAGSVLDCKAGQTRLNEHLQQWEERNRIAILNISRTALKINGDVLGQLAIANCCSADPCVAPDAASVAWIPSIQSFQTNSFENSIVRVSDGINSIRTLNYHGRLARVVAISSNATRMVVVAIGVNGRDSLLLVDDKSEKDLTPLVTRINPSEIERVRLSGNGELLAVGSRSSLIVCNLRSRKVVFESSGRFPALSPDGENLTYVDEQEHLVCQNMHKGIKKFLRQESKICGVGGWSPDSRYVLVGKRMPFSFWNRLILVDVAEDRAVDLFKLGEGDYGSRCVWISRRLVSA